MHIIITVRDIVTVIIMGLLILIIVGGLVKICINRLLYKLGYYKNCFKCKHYKITDVASTGDCCWYECIKHNKENRHSFNDSILLKHCKNFEPKN